MMRALAFGAFVSGLLPIALSAEPYRVIGPSIFLGAPETIVGETVTPSFLLRCFQADGLSYVCYSSGYTREIVVFSSGMSDGNLKKRITQRCDSHQSACATVPGKVHFKVDQTGLDPSGNVQWIRTSNILVDY